MTTLPTFTKTIDNAFVHTWYEIRTEAIDNILDSMVLWAALKNAGCFQTQVGGDIISRTIRYAFVNATAFAKGDTLTQGEVESETMARWTWRQLGSHVQRTLIDDQRNSGKFRIKSYIATRLRDAKDGLKQKYEDDLERAIVTDETGKEIQGLNDLLPPFASRATGTYGLIARSNSWWQAKYKQWDAPREVNLLSNMKSLYNTIYNGQEPPNLIVTTQALFEIYEEFAMDAVQVVQDESTHLANLGFSVLRFKGKPLVWSPNVAADTMKMLNTNYIEVIYDPNYWFAMGPWKDIALQHERLAHIVCVMNLIGTQPRRHGLLYA